MTLLLALPVGLVIGLSLGALGAGGSILTVPALVYLLGQDPHAATTMSLVIVGVSALTGVFAHRRAGRVRLGQGLAFGLLGSVGSVAGAKASSLVSPTVLLLGFSGLMVLAAVAMFARRRKRPEPAPAGDEGGGGGSGVATITRPKAGVARSVKVVVAATVVGLLTGFFGVGGGFVVVPALVLALGFDGATAVGTSLVVIALNSAVALSSRLLTQTTTVNWPLLGLFVAAAMIGVLLGNRVASRVSPDRLTTAFGIMLVLIAGYSAVQSITQLV
ncbi:sulfite exporter TauE/SafE family protein [Amycolatopsis rhizosphaerae]|uniref:Probable membrane transporter protein n=1 Tax=Amycolatopsis rhizosphaerae TaxID=2053003 RepID=A0A558CRG6_9PSEU|nr:sulfite exporter TauE/SafE family protein [Amycolatopsis rhizosphaerae]TVT51365.1 sulfite exporter TauE/SafE family protein [Amycolatopsis rhizosphaerae]